MSTPLFNYAGKTAAVTGASGGLGQALVQQLRDRGAAVTPITRQAHWDPAEYQLLFLNAGVGHVQGSAAEVLPEAEEMFRVNFLQTVAQAQRALAGRCAHVHVVGSVLAHVAAPQLALYSASKHALRGWAYGCARELPGRVSISYPNGMRSRFFDNLRGDPALLAHYAAAVEQAQAAYDPPEVVAQGILQGLQHGGREIIPSAFALDWFISNEVDIRRMWHPGLSQPSREAWDWWPAVRGQLATLQSVARSQDGAL